MTVALGVALGNLRLLELPNGGSISLSVLPALCLAVVSGWRHGAIAGTLTGLLHATMGGTIVHPVQLVLDYGLAGTALGIAGLGGRSPSRVVTAALVTVAMIVRGTCFIVSGMAFFGSGMHTAAAFWYSLAYNATTVVPETVLAVAILPTLTHALVRSGISNSMRGSDSDHLEWSVNGRIAKDTSGNAPVIPVLDNYGSSVLNQLPIVMTDTTIDPPMSFTVSVTTEHHLPVERERQPRFAIRRPTALQVTVDFTSI